MMGRSGLKMLRCWSWEAYCATGTGTTKPPVSQITVAPNMWWRKCWEMNTIRDERSAFCASRLSDASLQCTRILLSCIRIGANIEACIGRVPIYQYQCNLTNKLSLECVTQDHWSDVLLTAVRKATQQPNNDSLAIMGWVANCKFSTY